MMSAGEKYGVPLGNGSRGGILMPLLRHKFRVMGCNHAITAQVEYVKFNFAAKTIEIQVRSTVEAESFEQAIKFVHNDKWHVEPMQGNDLPEFGIKPLGLKLASHDFELSYASGKYASHTYNWTYTQLEVMYPVKVEQIAPVPPVTDFPTPAEAMAAMEKKGLTGGRSLLNEDDIGDNRTDGC